MILCDDPLYLYIYIYLKCTISSNIYSYSKEYTCVFAGIYNFSLFLRKCLSDVGGAFFGKAHFLIFRDFAEFMLFFPGFLVLTWACSNRLSHEDPSTWLPQESIEIHRFSQPFSPYLLLVSEIWWPRAPRDWWMGFDVIGKREHFGPSLIACFQLLFADGFSV